MIFDELGLPRVQGASDLQDSAAFAGMLTVFGWPQSIPLEKYVIEENAVKKYVRHPLERIYNFSRDQYVCLIAGLKTQDRTDLVDQSYVDGKDFMSPSIKGHERRCKGLKAYFWQDWNLWLDLWFSAKFKPLDELNQVLSIMMIAPPKFAKWYDKANPNWRAAVLNYWCHGAGAWRSEPEFAALQIAAFEKRISTDTV